MTHNADPVADLLRRAGPRETAPAERARRVEAAVRVEWQDVVQKRLGQRRAAWIAASCLTSAALIALVLHAHVGQAAPESAAASSTYPAQPYVTRTARSQSEGSYFRVNNEDRPPDRGVPRHVLVTYSWPTK
jgi:hypothetical protein